MKNRGIASFIGCCALSALAASSAVPHDDDRAQAAEPNKAQAAELIRLAREATARYRDPGAAERDGYQLLFGCVTGPDAGAMGLHYVNMGLVMDGELDATRPEIVIYEPLPNGRRRLIGVDYLVLAADWHANNPEAPVLGGQLMHLFEAPNRFALPTFYTLHVWAWKDNPTGMFVNWHSKVACDSFDG